MSMYNAIFGKNPLSTVLLKILGTSEEYVPRFRDCYLADGAAVICIYTRTGGGNREYYENEDSCRANYPEYFAPGKPPPSGPWNEDLRHLPGFIGDEDDDFDSTYATFRYAVPETFREMVTLLLDKDSAPAPAERWRAMLDGLSKGDSTSPDVRRAMKVGDYLMGQIKQWVKTPTE